MPPKQPQSNFRKRHFKGNNKSQDRNRRKEHAEKWKQTRGDDSNRNGYDTPTSNPRMEAFYKAQGFVAEEEWDRFLLALRSPLPACFRINHDHIFADELAKQLLDFAGESLEVDGATMHAVEKLAWYPNGYGYKLGTDRRNLRKLPGLEQLHQWMIKHTDMGHITRQEAVSMVPPLALDVHPHHQCLDMCAAPGSKTSQLLEVVDKSMHAPLGEQGCVVANDADTDRAYMLVHQCKRINSPQLVVTTHSGQLFPKITPPEYNDSTPYKIRDGYFDRVLCDVPCSGDGTLRKNPCIWGKWSTASGMTLHPLQLQIASRGIQLLKTGGLMVYSTCSMSPYEDEAVVAELLRNSRGTLELVDARQFLPLFRARPGMSTWHVLDDYGAIKKAAHARRMDKKDSKLEAKSESNADASTTMIVDDADAGASVPQTDEVSDDEEESDAELADETPSEQPSKKAKLSREPHPNPLVEACLQQGMDLFTDFASVPSYIQKKIRKSVFPPTEEEAKWMRLDLCLRCVPHDEDTGGFFVATLRKLPRPTKASDGANESDVANPATADGEVEEKLEDLGNVVGFEDGAEDATGAAGGCAVNEHQDRDDQAQKKLKAEDGSEIPKVPGTRKREATHGLVDFKNWDVAAFNKVKEFYGISEAVPAESMFVREDYATVSSANEGVASKTVYFIPASVRQLLKGDREEKMKIVCAGIKVFEKKVKGDGDVEYRILQEGLKVLVPHITTRKVFVNAQDFSNLLGGGLVSFNTLSAGTVSKCSSMPPGAIIIVYRFSPADVLPADGQPPTSVVSTEVDELDESLDGTSLDHCIYCVCWRGQTRTLNVMCGQTEINSMIHQMQALRVLRPKICVPKRVVDESKPKLSSAAAAAIAAVAAANAVTAGAVAVASSETAVTPAVVEGTDSTRIDTDVTTSSNLVE